MKCITCGGYAYELADEVRCYACNMDERLCTCNKKKNKKKKIKK